MRQNYRHLCNICIPEEVTKFECQSILLLRRTHLELHTRSHLLVRGGGGEGEGECVTVCVFNDFFNDMRTRRDTIFFCGEDVLDSGKRFNDVDKDIQRRIPLLQGLPEEEVVPMVFLYF